MVERQSLILLLVVGVRQSQFLLLMGVLAVVCVSVNNNMKTMPQFSTQNGVVMSRSTPMNASTTNTTRGQRTASLIAPDTTTDTTIVKMEAPLRDDFSQNPTSSDENPLGKVNNSFSSQKIMFQGTEPPQNLHIAFIGDSVTRFQYTSLVYYLHHGRHVTDEERPNRLWVQPNGEPKPKETHFNFSSILLRPNEECDCYRTYKWKPRTIVDNRYYLDPVRNNSVSLLLKYGDFPVHGHWPPAQVHEPHNLSFTQDKPQWKGDWATGIRHLSQLKPKPKYLIFNAGFHVNDLWNVTVRDAIQEALNETGIIGIYRWTTHKQNGLLPLHVVHEQALCELMEYRCLNPSWTQNLTEADYYDEVHFNAGPNKRMNEELIMLLRELEEKQ